MEPATPDTSVNPDGPLTPSVLTEEGYGDWRRQWNEETTAEGLLRHLHGLPFHLRVEDPAPFAFLLGLAEATREGWGCDCSRPTVCRHADVIGRVHRLIAKSFLVDNDEPLLPLVLRYTPDLLPQVLRVFSQHTFFQHWPHAVRALVRWCLEVRQNPERFPEQLVRIVREYLPAILGANERAVDQVNALQVINKDYFTQVPPTVQMAYRQLAFRPDADGNVPESLEDALTFPACAPFAARLLIWEAYERARAAKSATWRAANPL